MGEIALDHGTRAERNTFTRENFQTVAKTMITEDCSHSYIKANSIEHWKFSFQRNRQVLTRGLNASQNSERIGQVLP